MMGSDNYRYPFKQVSNRYESIQSYVKNQNHNNININMSMSTNDMSESGVGIGVGLVGMDMNMDMDKGQIPLHFTGLKNDSSSRGGSSSVATDGDMICSMDEWMANMDMKRQSDIDMNISMSMSMNMEMDMNLDIERYRDRDRGIDLDTGLDSSSNHHAHYEYCSDVREYYNRHTGSVKQEEDSGQAEGEGEGDGDSTSVIMATAVQGHCHEIHNSISDLDMSIRSTSSSSGNSSSSSVSVDNTPKALPMAAPTGTVKRRRIETRKASMEFQRPIAPSISHRSLSDTSSIDIEDDDPEQDPDQSKASTGATTRNRRQAATKGFQRVASTPLPVPSSPSSSSSTCRNTISAIKHRAYDKQRRLKFKYAIDKLYDEIRQYNSVHDSKLTTADILNETVSCIKSLRTELNTLTKSISVNHSNTQQT
jgi:hypothetical protein